MGVFIGKHWIYIHIIAFSCHVLFQKKKLFVFTIVKHKMALYLPIHLAYLYPVTLNLGIIFGH